MRELKPDNPKALAKGKRQAELYRQQLEELTGEKWTTAVDVYQQ